MNQTALKNSSKAEKSGAVTTTAQISDGVSFSRWRPRSVHWHKRPMLAAWILMPVVGYLLWNTFLVLYDLHVPQLLIPGIGFGSRLLGFARFSNAPDSVHNLVDLPTDRTQYPVRVKISYDELYMGTDYGVITFEEGSLLFEGEKTEFGFGPAVTTVVTPGTLRPPTDVTIAWLHKAYGGRVTITPYNRLSRVGKGYRKQFNAELATWRKPEPKRSGFCKLPPNTLIRSCSRACKGIAKLL